MKIYLVALATGLLVGVIYGLLDVRSPAPPVVALVGLLGILVGEQLVPIAQMCIRDRTYAAEVETSPIRTMIVNPGPLRTRMRAAAMPGEDPLTLRTPEEIAPKIVALCGPDWQRSGLIYDFPTDSVLTPQRPA